MVFDEIGMKYYISINLYYIFAGCLFYRLIPDCRQSKPIVRLPYMYHRYGKILYKGINFFYD